MKKGSLKLATVKGIGIWVHWSFSLLLLFVIWQSWSAAQSVGQALTGVVFILIVFLCVVLHELGHALTARRFGIKTKSIVLLPIGGVANMERIPEKPKHELLIALAGPAVNLVIALITGLLILLFVDQRVMERIVNGEVESLPMLFNIMAVNVMLLLFNLLPAFPMDGGRVLRAALAMRMDRVKATNIAATIGKVFALGFIVLGFYASPFIILIGVFILLAATSEANMTRVKESLKGKVARQAMRTKFITLLPTDTMTNARIELLAGTERDFLVMREGQVEGVLTRDAIVLAGKGDADRLLVEEFMEREFQAIAPDEPLGELYTDLLTGKHKLIPVVEEGQVIGVVESENLAEMIMLEDTPPAGLGVFRRVEQH